jgi:hypothetical protein
MLVVLIKGQIKMQKETYVQEECCMTIMARILGTYSISKRMPKIVRRTTEARKETWNKFSLTALGRH